MFKQRQYMFKEKQWIFKENNACSRRNNSCSRKKWKNFLSKSYKSPPLLPSFSFHLNKNLEGGGGFCKISKKYFSINSENFSMVINTPNIYPRVRTNIGGHKSIILDHFHEHFLVTKKFWRGVFCKIFLTT